MDWQADYGRLCFNSMHAQTSFGFCVPVLAFRVEGCSGYNFWFYVEVLGWTGLFAGLPIAVFTGCTLRISKLSEGSSGCCIDLGQADPVGILRGSSSSRFPTFMQIFCKFKGLPCFDLMTRSIRNISLSALSTAYPTDWLVR